MSAAETVKKHFDWKITVGNLLTIVMIIVGAIFSYATMKSDNSTTREKLESHMASQNEYVRKDVQETRNNFIDKEISDINNNLKDLNRKMDQVIRELKVAR